MDLLWSSLTEAWNLLAAGDSEVFGITVLTLQVSALATVISLAIGVPLGTFLALGSFPGRRVVIGTVNAGMGLPPVVVGLIVAILLWRSGILGFLGLIYTPGAMVISQVIIALPVVAGLTAAAMQQVEPALRLQILSLGASRWQYLCLLVRETRLPLIVAAMAGFGAAISEMGASMMVGGNVASQTRVLTTATVLEVSKGNFEFAIALSVLLLVLVGVVTAVMTRAQQRAFRQPYVSSSR